jgi:hypothetical protein
MWKRRWWLVVVGSLLGIALATYFEPTRCLRGWLWGEAFFEGRPTSYWREIIAQDLQSDPRILAGVMPPPPGSWWDRCIAGIGIQRKEESSFQLAKSRDADPILHQLRHHENSRTGAFAGGILDGIRSRQPFGSDAEEFRAWMQLICKHHQNPQDFAKLLGYE